MENIYLGRVTVNRLVQKAAHPGRGILLQVDLDCNTSALLSRSSTSPGSLPDHVDLMGKGYGVTEDPG